MKVGIAITPNIELIEKLIVFQNRCSSIVKLEPLFGYDINRPHISLVHGDFDKSTNFKFILDSISSKTKNIMIKFSKIKYMPIGWFFLMVKKNEPLVNIHNSTFDLVKHNFIPPKKPIRKQIDHYSVLEKENYLKYGYRYIKEAYLPHITLGRIDSEYDEGYTLEFQRLFNISELNQTYKFDKICIFKLGPNGSYGKTIVTSYF